MSPAASLRCSSSRYPGILTISVPCDGVVECWDGADEVSCTKQPLSNYLLVGSIVIIVMLYLGFKVYRNNIFKLKNSKTSTSIEQLKFIHRGFESSQNKSKYVSKVNTFLLQTMYSKKTKESKEILK